VERVEGIEPSPEAWNASALPLSYTRTQEIVAAAPAKCKTRAALLTTA
jgi:hypothetical protein